MTGDKTFKCYPRACCEGMMHPGCTLGAQECVRTLKYRLTDSMTLIDASYASHAIYFSVVLEPSSGDGLDTLHAVGASVGL